MHNSYANKQQQRLQPEKKIRKKIENENTKTGKNTSKVQKYE